MTLLDVDAELGLAIGEEGLHLRIALAALCHVAHHRSASDISTSSPKFLTRKCRPLR